MELLLIHSAGGALMIHGRTMTTVLRVNGYGMLVRLQMIGIMPSKVLG